MLKYLCNKQGQGLIEYATIMTIVIAAVIVMGPYVIRSWNADIKGYEDSVRDSYEDPLKEPGTIPEIAGDECYCYWSNPCTGKPEDDTLCCGASGCEANQTAKVYACPSGCKDASPYPDEHVICELSQGCCGPWAKKETDFCASTCGSETCEYGELCQQRICTAEDNATTTESRCVPYSGCEYKCYPDYQSYRTQGYGNKCVGTDINLSKNEQWSFVEAGDCAAPAYANTKCLAQCAEGYTSEDDRCRKDCPTNLAAEKIWRGCGETRWKEGTVGVNEFKIIDSDGGSFDLPVGHKIKKEHIRNITWDWSTVSDIPVYVEGASYHLFNHDRVSEINADIELYGAMKRSSCDCDPFYLRNDLGLPFDNHSENVTAKAVFDANDVLEYIQLWSCSPDSRGNVGFSSSPVKVNIELSSFGDATIDTILFPETDATYVSDPFVITIPEELKGKDYILEVGCNEAGVRRTSDGVSLCEDPNNGPKWPKFTVIPWYDTITTDSFEIKFYAPAQPDQHGHGSVSIVAKMANPCSCSEYTRECGDDDDFARAQGLPFVHSTHHWAFCQPGDVLVGCVDTATKGNKHWIDNVGEIYGGRAGCSSGSGSNNRGNQGCRITCRPAGGSCDEVAACTLNSFEGDRKQCSGSWNGGDGENIKYVESDPNINDRASCAAWCLEEPNLECVGFWIFPHNGSTRCSCFTGGSRIQRVGSSSAGDFFAAECEDLMTKEEACWEAMLGFKGDLDLESMSYSEISGQSICDGNDGDNNRSKDYWCESRGSDAYSPSDYECTWSHADGN